MPLDDVRLELPAMVIDGLGTLDDRRRAMFFEEYARRRKPTGWAYVLWLMGWHIGYIEGRWGFNVLYWLAIGPTLGIWWAVELFKVKGRLAGQRRSAAIAAMSDLRATAGAGTVAPSRR